MQKKVDRRVRKTKSQLRTGLARLMQEKGIGEITVKELVNEVDINRSTFYLHYSDIPALLREIEDDMMEEMERAVREHPIKEDSTSRFIEDIFRVLNENREISRALIGPHGDLLDDLIQQEGLILQNLGQQSLILGGAVRTFLQLLQPGGQLGLLLLPPGGQPVQLRPAQRPVQKGLHRPVPPETAGLKAVVQTRPLRLGRLDGQLGEDLGLNGGAVQRQPVHRRRHRRRAVFGGVRRHGGPPVRGAGPGLP